MTEKVTLTPGELLVARGIHALIRMSASPPPTNERAYLEHFTRLKNDVGAWLDDYASAVQNTLDPPPQGYDGGPIDQH